jgi:hypothetical protein
MKEENIQKICNMIVKIRTAGKNIEETFRNLEKNSEIENIRVR